MPEPLLFLDVDGCLLVKADPGGYKLFEYANDNRWYNPMMPEWMQSLDIQYDIRWSSHHWRGEMATALAKEIGIDTKLTHLQFDHPDVDHVDMRPEKLEAIKKVTGSIPAAILDDRMGPIVEEWAKDKVVLLIQPDHAIGITEPEYNLLKSFGEVHAAKSELVESFVKCAAAGPQEFEGEYY